MTICLFACRVLHFRLAEEILTQATQSIREAERIALDYLQIRRGNKSDRLSSAVMTQCLPGSATPSSVERPPSPTPTIPSWLGPLQSS